MKRLIIFLGIFLGILFLIPFISGKTAVTEGLVHYWDFEEISGNLVDRVFGLTNGTINGTVQNQTGIINKSYNFTARNSGSSRSTVDMQHWYTVNGSLVNWSVALWFNPETTNLTTSGDFRQMLGHASAGANNWFHIELSPNNVHIEHRGASATVDRSVLVTEKRWNHIVVTSNGTTMTVYKNGTLDTLIAFTSTANFTNSPFILGGALTTVSADAIGNYSGFMDEVGFWNRTLTNSEITRLYNEFLIKEIGQTFNNQTFELSTESFTINISYDNSTYNTVIGTLIYNNTRYLGSQSGTPPNLQFSRTISVPSISGNINKTFYWEFELLNGSSTSFFANSTSNNQSVLNLGIDECSTNTIRLINYTAFDEGDGTFLNGLTDNVTIEIDLSILAHDLSGSIDFNHNYNRTNPAEVCVSNNILNSSNLRLDVQTSYSALNRVKEYHHIQNRTINNGTIPINISLLDLKIVDSQEFKITVKDGNFVPLENALVVITRKYVGDAKFKTVEIPRTDSFGETIGHFVLNDVIYTIFIQKEGKTLATFDNIAVFCEDVSTGNCKLNFNLEADTTVFSGFNPGTNMTWTTNYNEVTRTFQFIFTTTDGAEKTVLLNITSFDAFNNKTLCSSTLSAQSGTLSCTIAASEGNATAIARVTVGNQLITQVIFQLLGSTNLIDNSRIILAVLLLVTLPLIGFTSGGMMLILFIIGFVLAGALGLISVGDWIGPASVILWLIVATGIIIWKVTKKEDKN